MLSGGQTINVVKETLPKLPAVDWHIHTIYNFPSCAHWLIFIGRSNFLNLSVIQIMSLLTRMCFVFKSMSASWKNHSKHLQWVSSDWVKIFLIWRTTIAKKMDKNMFSYGANARCCMSLLYCLVVLVNIQVIWSPNQIEVPSLTVIKLLHI